MRSTTLLTLTALFAIAAVSAENCYCFGAGTEEKPDPGYESCKIATSQNQPAPAAPVTEYCSADKAANQPLLCCDDCRALEPQNFALPQQRGNTKVCDPERFGCPDYVAQFWIAQSSSWSIQQSGQQKDPSFTMITGTTPQFIADRMQATKPAARRSLKGRFQRIDQSKE